MDPYDPPLDKARHLRYWQRCVRTLLPHHYTSMDSTRLSLGFFIIASIDLLSTPSSSSSSSSKETKPKPPLLTPADRRNLRRWVLACQHPDGGFCGSPTHVFPRATQTADNDSENAHIGGTYFALLLLAILAEEENDDDDDEKAGNGGEKEEDGARATRGGGGGGARSAFAGVDRVRTLRWLRRLQRPEDGSFGEAVYDPPTRSTTDSKDNDDDGNNKAESEEEEEVPPIVAGGRDMRYCYLAASVRWMLRGDLPPGDKDYVDDIDIPALVAHIHRGQTYDGGFAESWQHESHAGYAYCAVAALAMLDRPLESGGDDEEPRTPYHFAKNSEVLRKGVGDLQRLVSFLMSRQFAYLNPPSNEDDDDDNADDDDPETANFRLADLSLTDDAKYIGFNGRCNKIADTCYTWWTQGTLAVLGLLNTSFSPSCPSSSSTTTTTTITMPADPTALKAQRAFLLEKTQHIIGGFGKNPGSPPDVGHGCLGLAALATMGDPSLKRLDPALCVSVDTVAKVERARRGLLNRAEKGAAGERNVLRGGAEFGLRLVDMATSMRGQGERPTWLDGSVVA